VVLVLRFGMELSQREIAERLGISQMHVSRLLRAAMAEIADEGEGDAPSG
jgi:RNA polymerase sigma-B factor